MCATVYLLRSGKACPSGPRPSSDACQIQSLLALVARRVRLLADVCITGTQGHLEPQGLLGYGWSGCWCTCTEVTAHTRTLPRISTASCSQASAVSWLQIHEVLPGLTTNTCFLTSAVLPGPSASSRSSTSFTSARVHLRPASSALFFLPFACTHGSLPDFNIVCCCSMST